MSRRIFLICGLSISLIGCQSETSGETDISGKEREEIIEDFASNPRAAKNLYEQRWHETAASPEHLSQVGKIVVAGELMAHGDPAQYMTYYKYVAGQANSEREDIAAVAMSALSRARGMESAKLLVKFTDDKRDDVALEAMTAINYRLATSFYDTALAEEKDFLMSKLPDLCRKKHAVELSQFCKGKQGSE